MSLSNPDILSYSFLSFVDWRHNVGLQCKKRILFDVLPVQPVVCREDCEGECLEQVKMLAEQGVRELTLLGQNVNSYTDFSRQAAPQRASVPAPFSVYAEVSVTAVRRNVQRLRSHNGRISDLERATSPPTILFVGDSPRAEIRRVLLAAGVPKRLQAEAWRRRLLCRASGRGRSS